jgi:hypothetical protein
MIYLRIPIRLCYEYAIITRPCPFMAGYYEKEGSRKSAREEAKQRVPFGTSVGLPF